MTESSWAQPPRKSGDVPRMRRTADETTLVSVLLGLLPKFVLSLIVVVLIATNLGAPWGPILVVAWLASGALLFLRPVEQLIAQLFLHARKPTPSEHQQLARLWSNVTRSSGVDPASYTLWIEQGDRPNAYAAGGHIVAVTSWALHNLEPHELEAILAHELGHHLRGHAWVSQLIWWYSWPGIVTLRIIRVGTRLALWVVGHVARAAAVTGVGAIIGLALLIIALVYGGIIMLMLLGIWIVGQPLLYLETVAARAGEMRADRTAVDLGYGPSLLSVLYKFLEAEGSRPPWYRRLFDTHPPTDKRIAAVEATVGATPYRPRGSAAAPPVQYPHAGPVQPFPALPPAAPGFAGPPRHGHPGYPPPGNSGQFPR